MQFSNTLKEANYTASFPDNYYAKVVQAKEHGMDIDMPSVGKTTILDPIVWRLGSKIQLATQLSTNKAFSATPMQVNISSCKI